MSNTQKKITSHFAIGNNNGIFERFYIHQTILLIKQISHVKNTIQYRYALENNNRTFQKPIFRSNINYSKQSNPKGLLHAVAPLQSNGNLFLFRTLIHSGTGQSG